MTERRQNLINTLAAQMKGFSYTKEQLEAMNNDELFEAYTTWNGIIGWADTLKDTVESIYNVELK